MRFFGVAVMFIGAVFAQDPIPAVQETSSPLTCKTILCQPGKVCVQEKIFCYVPPCPQPRPKCVDSNEPETCATKQCPAGTTCQQMAVMCIREPCPQPPATCVPEPRSLPCGENEERKECGSACEPQCNEPERNFCTLQCILNVCQCKNGFLRNPEGKCVAREQCPAHGDNNTTSCGQNEERKSCGTACEPTCQNPTPICTKQCINNVCQCQNGFIRDTYGRCVAKSECPNIPEQPELSCATIDCRDGFKCVQDTIMCIRAPCPQPQPRCEPISAPSNNSTNGSCRRNEEFRTCGTACEPQCGEYEPRPCTLQCIVNVCQCQLGFYRNPAGDCVSRNECPARTFQ